jgi:hypothetical protein
VLQSIEGKLNNIKRFLPRKVKKRGLFDIGGSALQFLFGVATQIDLRTLQDTVQELHSRQDMVAHSVQHQLSYFKQLDDNMSLDHKTLVTLSRDLKEFAQKAQEAFQEVASKFSMTAKLRESANLIKGLEFALARVELQLDETLTALQFGIHGKIPVNLIPPSILKDILTNVSRSLPDGYELTMEIQDNLPWFYQYVTADIAAAETGFLLVLSLPLKDLTTHYEVYKLFTFPTESFNGTWVRLIAEAPYFAINLVHRAHLLLSETNMKQCKGGQDLKVCPADVAALNNEILTCSLSLYLQLGQVPKLCAHEVLWSAPNTTLLRHGALVLFYTLEPRRAFFRCRNNAKWTSEALVLNGSGLIEGATACHVSMEGFHLRPVLRAETRFEGPKMQIFVPQLPHRQDRNALAAVHQFVGAPFFQDLPHESRSPVTWEHWSSLSETVSRLEHATPTSWYVTVLMSAASAFAVCLLYHLGCRYAPLMIQRCQDASSPTPPEADIPDSGKEPACLMERVTLSGVVSPSPTERFKKH